MVSAKSRIAFAVLVASLFGCTVGPDYSPPEVEVPADWGSTDLDQDVSSIEGTSIEEWWELFTDPVLESLIDRTLDNNLDLAVAAQRIEENRFRLGLARSDFFPDVDAAGAYARGRLSEETNPVVPPPASRTDDFYSLGFDSVWEIDVFGRVRRSVESAAATMDVSIEDYRDLVVILTAEVALAYVDVRTLQARIDFAETNAELQRDSAQLTRDRFEAQIAPELDVRQAELNLYSTQSIIPALRRARAAAVHRLGVLVGESPRALWAELEESAPIPTAPDQVVVGLPTELLRNRPDVRSAERALAAQTARVGIAVADLYPRFSLSGTFAFEALDAGDVFDQGARTTSLGPSFRWNLFDFGRVGNTIRAEEALAEQAFSNYQQTVLVSLEEAENAIVSFTEESARRDLLEQSVVAASRSAELVRELYRAGLTDFQNVLDTERSLFEQQDRLVESEGFVAASLIQLYKALGGGWAPVEEPIEEEPESTP